MLGTVGTLKGVASLEFITSGLLIDPGLATRGYLPNSNSYQSTSETCLRSRFLHPYTNQFGVP